MLDDWQIRVLYLLLVEIPNDLQLILAGAVFIRSNWRPAECPLDFSGLSSDPRRLTRSSTGFTAWRRKRLERAATRR